MLFEKDGKRDSDTEWRIYYLEWHLTVFLATITDPSLSLGMTPYHLPHYGSKSFADAQNDVLPSAVIQHRELPADSSQLTAHSYQPSFPFRKIRVIYKNSGKSIQFLYFSMYNKVQTEGSADHLYWCSFYLPVRKTAELENFVFSTR